MESKSTCLECSKAVKGRSDKKFCDEQCRNNFHNRINGDQLRIMRQINTSLRRNRKILSELLENGNRTARRSWLARRGFDFELITAVRQKRSGTPCYFCYDCGYMALDEHRFKLLQIQDAGS